jgi:hypothetical protein
MGVNVRELVLPAHTHTHTHTHTQVEHDAWCVHTHIHTHTFTHNHMRTRTHAHTHTQVDQHMIRCPCLETVQILNKKKALCTRLSVNALGNRLLRNSCSAGGKND